MSPTRVLIVEDERLVAEDLRDTLTHVGYEVAGLVSSGEKAIDKVAEVDPDVVLMDIHLSGEMDGVSAAQVIRTRHGTPVIYLTAFSNDQTLARARETDAFGFVVKPFQEKAVIAAIEMAVGKRNTERSHRRREEMLRSGLMKLPLGVIMTDEHDNIVFANSTARHQIGRAIDGPTPVAMSAVFARSPGTAATAPGEDGRGTITELSGRRLEVYFSEEPLSGDNGRPIGRIVVYQDSEHPPFPGELGRLLHSLMQSTQASPNSPSQFLTICAWSNRIKVDDATWVSFEDFLTHYLGLNVTHGISPEVAKTWKSSGFKDPPYPHTH